jgi:dUTP pyrophosphatase
LAGVIDSNYRGEVCCVLYNTSHEPYTVKRGDKIAQMLIQKFELIDFEQVDQLSDSERGTKGWFSSGR